MGKRAGHAGMVGRDGRVLQGMTLIRRHEMGLGSIFGILLGIAGCLFLRVRYVVLERLAVLHTPSFNDMAVFLLSFYTKMGVLAMRPCGYRPLFPALIKHV